MEKGLPTEAEIEEVLKREHERFSLFQNLLLSENEKYNLTALVGEKEILYKHFYDSLYGIKAIPEGARAIEIGSGAGFPSVPLMLARQDLTFTLVESTGKKCDFLRGIVDKLGLRAEVVHARAEELARDGARRERYGCALARAVARMNTLAEYCLPFVEKGGIFLAYKGDAAEIAEAENAVRILGGGRAELLPYSLPEGQGERTLVRIRKERETPAKYPRGQGRERKCPLR